MKEKAAYALKDSDPVIILKHEKPEVIFKKTIEDLKTKGFSGKEVNPFYHHLSKLFYASNMMYMARDTNVMKSIAGKRFQSMDEINKTINKLWKEANEINVYHTDLRELALYVDYDQEKCIWSKGRPKLTPTKIGQLATDIQTAIELIRQWKTPSPLQKP